MNDQKFELERSLPTRAREIINKRRSQIDAACRRIEQLALRFEEPAPQASTLVSLDLITQSAQDEADSVRVLKSLSTESATKPEPAQSAIGELDIDMIRKQVEAA